MRTIAETGSTNDDVAALAAAGATEGLWLRAVRQTGGRGRHGRAWGSIAGNLHASTPVRIVRGDPPPATLALVAAVALHQVLAAHLGPHTGNLRIKWPNDLLLDGAKLSGILLEKRGEAVVVGFGVNLAGHPDIPERPVTSLPAAGIAAPEPAMFLSDLAEAFASWLGRWRGEGLAPVRARWLACAFPVGTPLVAHGGSGEALEGLFDGLEQDGALRLRLADGSRHVMHAGDVFLL
ncbi:biotin--[acetyl-CoA-carboxylase] ligase [Sphingomonas solaris]|uniref:biotin--[biotin carboxyl-carrier protein] ligase n=1 Tax=Alterirhizorhabdus solaris TaxID=2529389 RepID=A0A558R7B4_9SPHN|nr:biotin--[acetyl-CoA-carboxylase] ligase [Sphingomonas solaris]